MRKENPGTPSRVADLNTLPETIVEHLSCSGERQSGEIARALHLMPAISLSINPPTHSAARETKKL